jgi:hypothetical protein
MAIPFIFRERSQPLIKAKEEMEKIGTLLLRRLLETRKKCEKVEVTKSRQPSDMIGISGEISFVDHGHLSLTLNM